jgi:hypothetical protein
MMSHEGWITLNAKLILLGGPDINIIAIIITGMISTRPFDKQIIKVTSIFTRKCVCLKKVDCVINKNMEGSLIVKRKITVISLLETGNNLYLKSESGFSCNNINMFACCSAKSRDLKCPGQHERTSEFWMVYNQSTSDRKFVHSKFQNLSISISFQPASYQNMHYNWLIEMCRMRGSVSLGTYILVCPKILHIPSCVVKGD